MIKHGYPNILNKFPLLKTIYFNPSEFNKKYNNLSVVLNNINKLQLNMYNRNYHSEIVTFMNMKCIDFTKITALKLFCVGWPRRSAYNFNLFCELLRKFPNVNYLHIWSIYFDEIIDTNDMIAQLLPQLKVFTFESDDINANIFRDKLLQTHSKQITHLNYDEPKIGLNSDSIQSLNLQELIVTNPDIDSLSQLIKQSAQLKRVFVDISGGKINNSNNQKIKNIISSLYGKCCKLNEIQLCMVYEYFEKIIGWTEIELSNSECEHNYLKIIYEIYYEDSEISMDQIELYLIRIINALTLSLTKHFMVVFRLYGNMDTIEMKKKEELINKLKKRCLVFEEITSDTDLDGTYQRIIVSNKECIINGYQEIFT